MMSVCFGFEVHSTINSTSLLLLLSHRSAQSLGAWFLPADAKVEQRHTTMSTRGAPREISPSEIAVATGGFHTLAEVGEGGFGKVYRAMISHQPVAIKVMAADGLQGASEFDNERVLLSKLHHAHLVRLLGVCTSKDPPLRCLVYELMPGGNVEEQLAHQGGRCVLPWWLRLRLAAQISAAIAYLHTLPSSVGGPLIHRDIKPANMFLDGRLNAKLGDFGLAIPASNSSSRQQPRTQAGEVDMVGTYPYLPPEYKSSGTISVKGDVYALGVSLLQLATGRLERLHDLVPHVKQGLETGQVENLLDKKAGEWDETAGQRLLSLGLWAVTDHYDSRPSSSVIAQELAKLWVAADQALKLQENWGTAAAAAGPGSSGLQGSQGSGAWQQAAGLGSIGLGSGGGSSGGGAGGPGGVAGSFWKFLTSTGPHVNRA